MPHTSTPFDFAQGKSLSTSAPSPMPNLKIQNPKSKIQNCYG
ncbi:hypothetical protein [Nostoc sp.]